TYWLACCKILDMAEVELPTRRTTSADATRFHSLTIAWHNIIEESKRSRLCSIGLHYSNTPWHSFTVIPLVAGLTWTVGPGFQCSNKFVCLDLCVYETL
ncbi:hypothetical protein D1BOALGB6SA_4718, partial [Olavius sp. associated proteobacterium Delta 1]